MRRFLATLVLLVGIFAAAEAQQAAWVVECGWTAEAEAVTHTPAAVVHLIG